MGNFIPSCARPAETSSRCVTDTVTATHDFEVHNYPLLDGLGVGKYVNSSTFSAGGCDWCIMFYPDGKNEENAGYTSAFLNCLSPPADGVRTKVTIQKKENMAQATKLGHHEYTFTEANHGLGFLKFIEKSKLKSLSNGDVLTIRCIVTVVQESRTESKTNLIVVPPPELSGQLERALRAGKGADITLDVGGRVFTAHKFMLAARSPVFDAQLFGPMTEKDTKHIEIVDVEPAIFAMLLHFIYTDSLTPCVDRKGNGAATMQHLLVAADRYGLDRLKVMCEEKLSRRIDVKTVTSTMALADRHYCRRLMDACLAFISLPGVMRAVVGTDGFKHITGSCPLLVFKEELEEK